MVTRHRQYENIIEIHIELSQRYHRDTYRASYHRDIIEIHIELSQRYHRDTYRVNTGIS